MSEIETVSTESKPAGKPIPVQVMDFFSSYLLTIVIFLCLMVLVYFGTRLQEQHGLNYVVHELFESWVCVIDTTELGILPIPFRWPGAALLLSLLAVNIICGGIVRLKKGQRTVGVLFTHLAVLFLLLAGWVQAVWGTNGYVKLFPGESTDEYTSFTEYEIAIGERRDDGTVREHLISDVELRRNPTVTSADLPFKLVVERYFVNCEPRKAGASDRDAVEGIALAPRKRDKERNFPGAIVDVVIDGQPVQRGVLWSLQRHPWTIKAGGTKWTIDLRPQVFDLPFEVRLEKFRQETHPGIRSARHFSSDVTKIEDGAEQRFHIAMNEPMRYAGYMFSQNDWGPQDPGSEGPFYSVLEVSTNPADRWQLWACILIGLGMSIHFLSKLTKHMDKQAKVRGSA